MACLVEVALAQGRESWISPLPQMMYHVAQQMCSSRLLALTRPGTVRARRLGGG
jgi:hypothetical protein